MAIRMPLTAVPKSWFSWDFWLKEPGGEAVAEVCLSSWRERGSVVVNGDTHRIYRKGLLGPFVMEAPDGSVVASATKASAFRRAFAIADSERRYVLKTVFAFRRECGVFRGEHRIGSIVPRSWLGRRASAQFAGEVPPVLQAFLTWLTLLLWKRESDAAG
jgi:hypothetical protein